MTVNYKGYEINVSREGNNSDAPLMWSIYRMSDDYECDANFYYGSETVREFISILKERIDNEEKEADPWCEISGII